MGFYLIQVAYTAEAGKAMVQKPQNREDAARKAAVAQFIEPVRRNKMRRRTLLKVCPKHVALAQRRQDRREDIIV